MKAIICTAYGNPEVLQMQEVEKPTAKINEILIKIKATSVTSGDARIRRADPYIIRLIFGYKKPRKSILGVVIAGEIEAVGSNVTKFKVGDKVFGSTGMAFGAYAEYTSLSQDAVLAKIPNNITFEQAAAIPFGATASIHFLRKGNIKQNIKVLIYGASGALGTAAVQLAKNYGAHVTAVCSTTNIELMKSLGADEVIDYTNTDFSKNGMMYDIIYDTVDKCDYNKAINSLTNKGTLMMASAEFGTILKSIYVNMFTKKTVLSGVIKETTEDMNYFKELIETNKLIPVIDKTYALKNMTDAHAYVDGGHKKGNVIVTI
jgi:2-desacetyl-2-hydroxyethyl bacteriochlorophyllide A dehydrogenase